MKLKFLLSFFLPVLLIGFQPVFAVDDEPMLLLHYSFEGNILDASGNGNNAIAVGTSGVPVYGESDGVKGKYLDLSGNTDNGAAALFISTPNSILKSADDAYTITGWTKINTADGRMQIINQPSDNNTLTQFLMKWYQASSSKAWISGYISGNEKFYHNSPPDLFAWFHFALVVDPVNDAMSLWYNGDLGIEVSAENGWADTIAPFFFGAKPDGTEANDGVYDEIYVYKGKLNAQQIKANISATNNLVFHYGFEDELTDGSGNGNDAIAFGTSGVPVYGESDGIKGKYLDLSGNTDNGAAALFIQTPDSILKSADDVYTLTGWAKLNTPEGRMQIINQPSDTNTLTQFLMKWYQEAQSKAWVSGYLSGNAKYYHKSPPDPFVWFHFALVVDPANDTMSLWYNGDFALGVSAENGWTDTIAPFFFGAKPDGTEANDGVYDEISLYDKLLTGDEIMALYMANKPCDPIDVTVMTNDIALHVASIEGASYQWVDCSDGSAVSGATDALYAPAESGEFKVTITVGECEGTSECTSITIITCDPIDVAVTKNDTALYVNGTEGASYQWIDCSDGSDVSGATDTLYAPAASGEFKVAITTSAECTDTSACTSITITTGINAMNDLGVSVYPNPVLDMLSVNLGAHTKAKIALINLVGQTVLQTSIDKQHSKLDMSMMDSGVYLLRVTIDDKSSVLRIIKQ